MHKLQKNTAKISFAFTLAEVLITLGIIGIVAAMTIPTLISSQRKSVAETRLLNFYSTMNQAIKLSEIDNGDKKDWDAMSDDTLTWYNKYLAPYIKTLKVDSRVSTPTKLILYFPNGSLALFTRMGWNFFPSADDLKYYEHYDGSSYTYVRTYSGTKYFSFLLVPDKTTADYTYHYNKGLEPYKYDWNGLLDGTKGLTTSSDYACKAALPANGRAYCAALIQQNSWKIPNDYPLKF